jgi:hypothetical protein
MADAKAREHMEAARTLLAQARLSFEHDRVNDAVRYAYLAALQAAQAYLSSRGDVLSHTPTSQALSLHSPDDLMASFARYAKVDPRLAEPDLSYHLGNTARLKAQYDIEPPASASSDLARIAGAITSAARFIDGLGGQRWDEW